MEERLIRLETKVDYIIELLKPVNAHAPFVDDLKTACQTNRILKTIINVRPHVQATPVPQIADEEITMLECTE